MQIGEICEKYEQVVLSCREPDQFEIAQRYGFLAKKAIEKGGKLNLIDTLFR